MTASAAASSEYQAKILMPPTTTVPYKTYTVLACGKYKWSTKPVLLFFFFSNSELLKFTLLVCLDVYVLRWK